MTAAVVKPIRVRIHDTVTGWEGWIVRSNVEAPWRHECDGLRLDDLTVSMARILDVEGEDL